MIGIEVQAAQATRGYAKKIIRRLTLCVEGRCSECDLNKRFDGGKCLNDTMEDARTLIEDAYFQDEEKQEEEKT